MADFMGDDGVDFIRRQKIQQCFGNQDVTESAYQAHYSGSNHAATEDRPVQDVRILQVGALAKGFDALTKGTGRQRVAAPEFLDDQWTENSHSKQEKQKIGGFTFR